MADTIMTNPTEPIAPTAAITMSFEVHNAISDAVGTANTAMNAKLDAKIDELKTLIAEKQGTATSPDAPTAIVMKASVHPPKSFDGNSDDVDHFLRKVKQYLSMTQIPADRTWTA